MAQVSNVDAELTSGEVEGEHTEESKRKSLLHAVKNKAKGTVRKLKDKVKKSSADTDERSSSPTGVGSDEEVEEPSLGSQKTSPTEPAGEAQSVSPHEGSEKLNGAEPLEASRGDADENILSPFARSGNSENSPLVAVPTSYSDSASGPVDAVMPSPVIEPVSVSDVGEESSANLGEIPEAKDEEKAAVREVHEGGPDSDINPGLKNTFKQKDLQAIDGLPKPRGFDINDESSVNSADLRGLLSQDVTDHLDTSQGVKPGTDELPNQTNRELPSGDADTIALEENKDHPHPPASTADFSDSMFSSNAIQDINPNQPATGEAKRAEEVGTFSRDSEGTPDSFQEKLADRTEPEKPLTSTAEPSQNFEPEQFESSEKGLDATAGAAAGATAATGLGAAAYASTAGHSHDQDSLKDDSGVKDSDVGSAQDAERIPSLDGERDRGNEFTRSLERNNCELSRSIESEKDPLTGKDSEEGLQGQAESRNESSRDLEGLSAHDTDPESAAPDSTTDLHDNMFSSAATHELNLTKPNRTGFGNEGTYGDSVREGDPEDNATFHEASKDLPPVTPDAESAKNNPSRAVSSDQVPPEKTTAHEKSLAGDDPDSFFDALDEDSVATPKGVDLEASKSRPYDPVDAYKKDSAPSAEPAESGTGVEIPKESLPSQDEDSVVTPEGVDSEASKSRAYDPLDAYKNDSAPSTKESAPSVEPAESGTGVEIPKESVPSQDKDSVATPEGIDSEASKSRAYDSLDAYKKDSAPSPKESSPSAEPAESGTGVEIPKESVPSQDTGVGTPSSPATLTSAFKSIVGSVGSRFGIGSAPPQGAPEQQQ